MEIDISDKVNRMLRYGAAGFLAALVVVAASVSLWQSGSRCIRLEDARIAGALVNAPTKVAGTVAAILVEEGARVEAGQPLAEIKVRISAEEVRQMEQSLAAAQSRYDELKARPVQTAQSAPASAPSGAAAARLERAQREKEKMEQLFAIGGVSAQRRDAAQAAYEAARRAADAPGGALIPSGPAMSADSKETLLRAAQLQVHQAQAALEAARQDLQAAPLAAAVDGTVYFNGVQLGDAVTAGQVLFRVGDLHEVWIEASLDAGQRQEIALGQFVEYEVDAYPGRVFRGTVSEIAENGADGQPLERPLVRISVAADPDVEIKPGMKVEARISV